MSPDFPQAVRTAVEAISDPEPVLRGLVDDGSVRYRVRFAAFYALLLRLRREERYGEYAALVRQYEHDFGAEPYFDTFRAIVARMKGDSASLRSAVEYSRKAAGLMPEVAGLLAAVVAFIATAANIASQAEGTHGIRLMVVASGAIAVVFGTFSLVNSSGLRRVFGAIGIGGVLLLVGIFLPMSWMNE